jgi:uncharacterized membrane protein HdeD (DUF308 family)
MSANDGWLLISAGIALMLMGIAMLAMPRRRVVARRIPTLRRLPAEMVVALTCTAAVAVAIVSLQWAVAVRPGSVALWTTVHGVPAFLAGASIARLYAVARVVRNERRRARALRRRIGGRG